MSDYKKMVLCHFDIFESLQYDKWYFEWSSMHLSCQVSIKRMNNITFTIQQVAE